MYNESALQSVPLKDALIKAHGTIIVSHASLLFHRKLRQCKLFQENALLPSDAIFMRKGGLGGSISAELTGALHDYAGPHKDINSFPARLFQGLGDMIAN